MSQYKLQASVAHTYLVVDLYAQSDQNLQHKHKSTCLSEVLLGKFASVGFAVPLLLCLGLFIYATVIMQQ